MQHCRSSYLPSRLCCNVKNLFAHSLIALTLLGSQAVLAQTDVVEKPAMQSQMNQSTMVLEISLIEEGDILVLYADGTCSLNEQEKINLNEETNPWQSILNKEYLERLSGLAILEQVKKQVQQSRIVIAIDTESETKLTIHANDYTKNIALYSVDLMHATYPKAQLLSQFMELVELLRKAKAACTL